MKTCIAATPNDHSVPWMWQKIVRPPTEAASNYSLAKNCVIVSINSSLGRTIACRGSFLFRPARRCPTPVSSRRIARVLVGFVHIYARPTGQAAPRLF